MTRRAGAYVPSVTVTHNINIIMQQNEYTIYYTLHISDILHFIYRINTFHILYFIICIFHIYTRIRMCKRSRRNLLPLMEMIDTVYSRHSTSVVFDGSTSSLLILSIFAKLVFGHMEQLRPINHRFGTYSKEKSSPMKLTTTNI